MLDEKLLSEAKKITGIGTTRGVVDHALRQLIRQHRQLSLLELRGKIHWKGDLSAMRRMKEM
jgi:Arc/MetJ family transcription regulator